MIETHIPTSHAIIAIAVLLCVMAAYQNKRFSRSLGHFIVVVAIGCVIFAWASSNGGFHFQ